MKRRITAAVMAAVFILSMTACSSPETNETETIDASEETIEAAASNESKTEPVTEDGSTAQAEDDTPLESKVEKENGMWKVLPEIPVTDVSELEYRFDDEGDGIIITDFLTDKKEIRIPDKIDGMPVVGIRLNENLSLSNYDGYTTRYEDFPEYKYYDITELILPDTVQEIYSAMIPARSPSAPALSKVEYMNYPAQLSYCNCYFSSLKSMYIAEGQTCIENYYYDGIYLPECLETLYIPVSMKAFSYRFIYNYSSLKTVYYDGTEYNGYTDELHHLINAVNGDGLAIKDNSLYGCYSTKETIVIPDGVEGVYNTPFNSNYTAKEISVPASVRYGFEISSMEGGHFNNCEELITVNFEKGSQILNLGDSFWNCPKLKSIALPDSCENVMYCFDNCPSLTSVTIPDSIKCISSCFKNCPNITEVIVGDNISSELDLGEIFSESKDNPEFIIVYRGEEYTLKEYEDALNGSPKGFSIRDGVLVEYYGTEPNVVVPDNVTKLASFAFMSDDNIDSVILPDSVTEIGAFSFSECTNLTYVKLPDNVSFALEILVHDPSTNTHEVTSYAFWKSPNVLVEYRGIIYDYDHIKDLKALVLDLENNPSIRLLEH